MSTIKYVVTSSIVNVEDVKLCSYGIACLKNNKKDCSIDDLSPNRSLVECKAELFNNHNLSPEHFIDAIDDFITEISI